LVKGRRDFVSKAYDNSLSTIKQADVKAGITLSLQSLLVSVGLTGSLVMGTFRKVQSPLIELSLKNTFLIFFFIFVGFSFLGIISSVIIFFPITRPSERKERKRKGLLFFQHIKNFETSAEYNAMIRSLSYNELLDELTKQTYSLAKVASNKMKFVVVSVVCLVINCALCFSVLIISGLIDMISNVGG